MAKRSTLLNGRGLDTPNQPRADDQCKSSRNPTPLLHVNSPASVVGDYLAGPAASFGPPFRTTGVTGNLVLVDDGVGTETASTSSRTDGCQTPFRNAAQVKGNIALVDAAGGCQFAVRVKNAQLNGAIAVIVAYGAVFGDVPRIMLGNDPTITIPSALIGYSDGQAFRTPGIRTVNVALKSDGAPTDDSYAWLIGEEFYRSAARDMWNPRCNGSPGKTSDREYFCQPLDSGGVHFNSGIPNHAYALLVDGGTYNNQNIAPIGFTKAAHIYFRAMSFYQTPTSDFADHAEALEASASDLEGVNLPDLLTGFPSGQAISQFDRDQVHRATLAVELRQPPTQCGFKPLLAKDPPADTCPAIQNRQATIFSDDFEDDPTSNWTISRDVSSADTFISRDWLWVHKLPDRPGSGFFAPEPVDDCSSAPPGQAGVLHRRS